MATMSHAQEIIPESWAKGPLATLLGEGEIGDPVILSVDVSMVLQRYDTLTDAMIVEELTLAAEDTAVNQSLEDLVDDLRAVFSSSTYFRELGNMADDANPVGTPGSSMELLPDS